MGHRNIPAPLLDGLIVVVCCAVAVVGVLAWDLSKPAVYKSSTSVLFAPPNDRGAAHRLAPALLSDKVTHAAAKKLGGQLPDCSISFPGTVVRLTCVAATGAGAAHAANETIRAYNKALQEKSVQQAALQLHLLAQQIQQNKTSTSATRSALASLSPHAPAFAAYVRQLTNQLTQQHVLVSNQQRQFGRLFSQAVGVNVLAVAIPPSRALSPFGALSLVIAAAAGLAVAIVAIVLRRKKHQRGIASQEAAT